jgi:glutathione S-transferase
MKLYGTALSPRYLRVAIAASELGVPLELIVLDVAKGDSRAPGYLAKNAMGKMPTFEDDDGWTLWESCAIVVYLGEKFPERGLYPTDARGHAEALRWLFWSASHLDPAVGSTYAQKFLAPMRGGKPDEAVLSASAKDLQRYLPILETHLEAHAWLLGERFSLVDVAIGASIDALFLPQLEVDRAPYSRITAWHERLAARPSWRAGR